MMNNHGRRFYVWGLFTLGTLILCSCFSAPTNTPCTPKVYPGTGVDEFKSAQIYTFETTDSYLEVIRFFRKELEFPTPVKDAYGPVKWKMSRINDSKMLFECGSVLNKHEAEIGCILIYNQEDRTVIETTWSYAEVGPAPCYVLPSLDYQEY